MLTWSLQRICSLSSGEKGSVDHSASRNLNTKVASSKSVSNHQSTGSQSDFRRAQEPFPRSHKRQKCRAELQDQLQTRSSPGERQPVAEHATAFAPATIANLGPGFDWLGCAVEVCLDMPEASNYHQLQVCRFRVFWCLPLNMQCHVCLSINLLESFARAMGACCSLFKM